MRLGDAVSLGLSALALAAAMTTLAQAQTPPVALAASGGYGAPSPWRVDSDSYPYANAADFTLNANSGFGGAFRLPENAFSPGHGELVTEAWRDTAAGAIERVRLSRSGDWLRADGAPLPLTPHDGGRLSDDASYNLTYTRGWPSRRYDPDTGLQMEVIPHAGFGVGSEGGSAEAGATIRVGSTLNRLVPEGDDAFDEDQGRWYVFAAGSSRAVGYNFARTHDGDFIRSGMSHDSGAFIGDAQVGVAWRRGDVQTSFGYVYRRHKVRELAGRDFERVQTEGVVAFQLSIRPDW